MKQTRMVDMQRDWKIIYPFETAAGAEMDN
jgi:hypothetical protein